MLFSKDFDVISMNTDDGSEYYLGELILNHYKDEYNKEYILTKGLNRFYLYKKSTYGNFYSTVAETKSKINEYIKNNKLIRKV